jgi:ABC-type branched-subunit amino acid transport system permease subunit
VKYGIDWAHMHETRADYAFHLMLGHHGLFSLTPFMFLALAGMVGGAARRRCEVPDGCIRFTFAAFTLLLTLIVVGFYLVQSDNYGGWSNGPRWLMWLTPLWVLCMVPVADRLANSRGGRALAYLLLGLSVMAMSYSPWNAWRHPWLYRFLDANGLIPY